MAHFRIVLYYWIIINDALMFKQLVMVGLISTALHTAVYLNP